MNFRDEVWCYIKICQHRISFFIYISILALVSVMELLSVGIVFPLLSSFVETGSDIFPFIEASRNLNLESREIIWLAIALFIIRAFILIIGSWYQSRFSQGLIVKLSSFVFLKIINTPVWDIETQKTSDLIRKVTGTISQVVNSHIIQVVNIFFECFTLFLIVCLVFTIITVEAFISAACILVGLIMFSKLISGTLARYGDEKRVYETSKVEYVQDIVGLSRTIKNFNLSEWFRDAFMMASRYSAKASIIQFTLSSVPRVVMELVIFVGGMLYLLLVVDLDQFATEIPLLGTLMFALLRLIPTVNKINVGWQSLRFSSSFVAELRDCVFGDVGRTGIGFETKWNSVSRNFVFESLTCEDLKVCRDGQVFGPYNFEISSGDWLLITGPTGCGKSTLVDSLLGFCPIHSGECKINGLPLTETLASFYQISAYVPQKVYLLSRSLRDNIFLDDDRGIVDNQRLSDVLALCDISNLGEREDLSRVSALDNSGISGGQRQRVGIARALIRGPQVLVLDESTAGLDNKIQEKILSNIKKEYPDLTVIMISHSMQIERFFNKRLRL